MKRSRENNVIVISSSDEEENERQARKKKKKSIVQNNNNNSNYSLPVLEIDLCSDEEKGGSTVPSHPRPPVIIYPKAPTHVVQPINNTKLTTPINNNDHDDDDVFRVPQQLSSNNNNTHDNNGINSSNNNINNIERVRTSSSSSILSTVLDKNTIQQIYADCSKLFKEHKITTTNCFSLKLVECLDEVLECEKFDGNKLNLAARTLEISGKIYYCRVEHTFKNTVNLASEIASNTTNELNNIFPSSQVSEGQSIEETNNDQRKIRPKIKKRFIENDESKLNTKFDNQNARYIKRRTLLKEKLHRLIDEELDFDYLSFFMKPGDRVHPLAKPSVSTCLDTPCTNVLIGVSRTRNDKSLSFLPFHFLREWHPDSHNIWGLPKTGIESDSECDYDSDYDVSLTREDLPEENIPEQEPEFSYNPESRPDEYPLNLSNLPDQSFPIQMEKNCNIENNNASSEETPQPELDVDHLTSLKDVNEYFATLKESHKKKSISQKFGWAGPLFVQKQKYQSPIAKKIVKKRVSKSALQNEKIIIFNAESLSKIDSYHDPKRCKIQISDREMALWCQERKDFYSESTELICDLNDEGFQNDRFENIFQSVEENQNSSLTRLFLTKDNYLDFMEKEAEENFRLKDSAVRVETATDVDEIRTEFQDDRPESPVFLFGNNEEYVDENTGHNDNTETNLNNEQPNSETTELPYEDNNNNSDPYISIMSMLPRDFLVASSKSSFESHNYDRLIHNDTTHNVSYVKKPKPINMFELRSTIQQVLISQLNLTENLASTSSTDTDTDFVSVMEETLKRLPKRFRMYFSVPLFVCGLLHVVSENKLFLMPGQYKNGFQNQKIVCRAMNWSHKDNVPMMQLNEDTTD